jgi:hypothetical protein
LYLHPSFLSGLHGLRQNIIERDMSKKIKEHVRELFKEANDAGSLSWRASRRI